MTTCDGLGRYKRLWCQCLAIVTGMMLATHALPMLTREEVAILVAFAEKERERERISHSASVG